jgi:hypothetical protein
MSRKKLRVPGRYERPAALRGPLGDKMTEAGIRDGYAAAVRARGMVRAARAAGELPDVDDQAPAYSTYDPTPVHVDGGTHDEFLEQRRQQVATVESATRYTVPPPKDGKGEAFIPFRRASTVESDTSTLERVDVVEASSGGVRKGDKPSLVTVDIIRSGWNKSGSRYYPAEVLERDIPVIYPAGCHMYIDHPSHTEAEDRPERSLTGLAAVFDTTPYAVREGDQTVMRVTARVYSRWREFLTEAAGDIGVSINGSGDGSITDREGRTGLVLERLTHGQSVDFVTKPGAGGRIVALLESARPFESDEFRAVLDRLSTRESASLGAWVESRIHLGFTQLADELYGDGRLTRPERIAASSAIGDALGVFVKAIETNAPELYKRDRWSEPPVVEDATVREASVDSQRAQIDHAIQSEYGGRDRFAWVRDFDPDAGVVWFTAGDHDRPSRVWQQAYSASPAGHVALLGSRVEVRERTVYEPVTPVVDTTEAGAFRPADADRERAAALLEHAATFHTQTPDGGKPSGSTADEAKNAKETAMTDTTVKDAAAREADEAIRTRESLELAQYRQFGKANDVLNSKLAESALPAVAQNRVRAGFPATALPLQESDRTLDANRFTTVVEAAIKAETDYVASILESAGVGKVTGNGAAQGAGAGMPNGFAPQQQTTVAGAGGVLFAGTTLAHTAGGAHIPVTEADAAVAKELRESLITEYTRRGATREAAELAVDAHV